MLTYSRGWTTWVAGCCWPTTSGKERWWRHLGGQRYSNQNTRTPGLYKLVQYNHTLVHRTVSYCKMCFLVFGYHYSVKSSRAFFCLWLLYGFLSLKNYVNVPSKSNKPENMEKNSFLLASWRLMTKIAGSGAESGSVPKCHGSATLFKRMERSFCLT